MRMARIAGRTRTRTRADLLVSASRAFGMLGFAGASLGAIAKDAGVSAATVCHHFGDKGTLYDAVTDEVYRQLLDVPEEAASYFLRPTLRETLDRIYAHCEARRDGIRFLLRRIMEGGGVDDGVRERHMAPLLASFTEQLSLHFGACPHDARVANVTVTHLIARFVTNSSEDNQLAFACKTRDEARNQILDVLTRVTHHLLYPTKAGAS